MVGNGPTGNRSWRWN